MRSAQVMALLHGAALAGVLALLIVIWRDVSRRSAAVGHVLLAGLLVRSGLGLALFAISYWDLPVLAHLHAGDGFWELAPDARMHYNHAREALVHGLASSWDHSAPLYVASYAIWMWLVGTNPASGMLLNLVAFGLFSAVAVRFFRPVGRLNEDLPCVLVVAGLGLLPSIVIHGTQSLKDDLVLISAGCALLAGAAAYTAPPGWRMLLTAGPAAAASGASLLFLTGLRSYFALMLVVCLALGAAVRTWTGRRAFAASAFTCVLFVTGSWAGYHVGEDPYWNPMRANEFAVSAAPGGAVPERGEPSLEAQNIDLIDAVLRRLRDSRLGFISSGGATNVVAVDALDAERAPGWRDDVSALMIGVALIFVPIDLLIALEVVEFTGGRGLLGISDLDTLLLDAMILGIGALAWRRRRPLTPRLAVTIVAASLFLLTTTLLAYAVTNYGTLFRLRAMILVPLWMLALVHHPSNSQAAGPAAAPACGPSSNPVATADPQGHDPDGR